MNKTVRYSKTVETVLDLIEREQIEIVSYGLAPNPFGFCYEIGDETTPEGCEELDALLNSLSNTEEAQLNQAIFG